MFVVLLVMAPSYLEVGASGKPGAVHKEACAQNRPVGVLSSNCTTSDAHTRPSAAGHRGDGNGGEIGGIEAKPITLAKPPNCPTKSSHLSLLLHS